MYIAMFSPPSRRILHMEMRRISIVPCILTQRSQIANRRDDNGSASAMPMGAAELKKLRAEHKEPLKMTIQLAA
jgi:hypothetical protein